MKVGQHGRARHGRGAGRGDQVLTGALEASEPPGTYPLLQGCIPLTLDGQWPRTVKVVLVQSQRIGQQSGSSSTKTISSARLLK